MTILNNHLFPHIAHLRPFDFEGVAHILRILLRVGYRERWLRGHVLKYILKGLKANVLDPRILFHVQFWSHSFRMRRRVLLVVRRYNPMWEWKVQYLGMAAGPFLGVGVTR